MGLVSYDTFTEYALFFTLYILFGHLAHILTLIHDFFFKHLHVSAYEKGVGVKWLEEAYIGKEDWHTWELSLGTSTHSFSDFEDFHDSFLTARLVVACKTAPGRRGRGVSLPAV